MNVVAILAMFQMRTIQTSVMVSLHKDYCYNYGSIVMVKLLIDFDECINSSYHNCSEAENEICNNTVGSFTCECIQGFDLNMNTKICEGEEEKFSQLLPFLNSFYLLRY